MEAISYPYIFGMMGVVSSVGLSTIGAAYGTAKASTGIAAVGTMKPELIMACMIPVVMAGIIGISGLIVGVLILPEIRMPGYTIYQGTMHLGAGLAMGTSGLATGIAIGIIGNSGVRGVGKEQRLLVGVTLMLVFAETLALYGLIVAILMYMAATYHPVF